MDYPYISINTPTYNRNKFLPLMIQNLNIQNYPKEKLEWVVLDDGTDKMIKSKEEEDNIQKLIYPIKLSYHYNPKKMSIGAKRNILVKKSKYKIIASMDSDDVYNPEYLAYSVGMLLYNKFGIVGSNQMIFVYPFNDWKVTAIECQDKRQMHEACMVFTKKHYNAMGGFRTKGVGEGCKMVDGMNPKTVGLTDIRKVMMCICHKDNTVKKDRFLESQIIKTEISNQLKMLINEILDIS